ncbi:unnamed protein product [Pedinophyceae sp. YPF-701]|nr:unnamed protein product [Pedinophyceae sp. YPF-701]
MPSTEDDFEFLKVLGKGNFGEAKLAKRKDTGELFAIKFLPRGAKITNHVEREILNHRQLQHPNVVQFQEVFLTKKELCIVMEYAEGGELFKRVQAQKRFPEETCRHYFQQILSGLHYCHKQGVCHRDLKLENCLLDSSSQELAQVKLADFGYSKHAVLQSNPNSTVGTPAYIAPEVLLANEYEGPPADIWSLGVTLYVMLCGRYPFEDPKDPKNFQKSLQRIVAVQYQFPSSVKPSPELQDLFDKILVADPKNRIKISEIWQHPWFKKNLPQDLAEEVAAESKGQKYSWFKKLASKVRQKRGATAEGKTDDELLAKQSPEEIKAIVQEARQDNQEVDMLEDDFDDEFF